MSNIARLYLGTEVTPDVAITNGGFDGNANGWVVPSGWNYDAGSMKGVLGLTTTLKQTITGLQVGGSYKVKFYLEFVGFFQGNITLNFGGVIKNYTTGGWKEEIITVVSGDEIQFTQSFSWRGRLDNVSISSFDSRHTWQEVHLSDDSFINLNYAIADIEDITKRGTVFSKTITVPSTVHNDQVMEHLYDLDVQTDNKYLNKKIPALLYYNDAEILNGICEITKVDTVHANNQAYYEIVLRGNAKTFADVVSSKYITGNAIKEDDIDFSEYNHTFNVSNIMATWYNPSFPSLPTSNYGSGYYYPIINYANIPDNNSYNFEQLRPAIYIKEIWDKIFADAGFTYESTFLNTTYFKSLITPFVNKIRTSEDELESRKFAAGLLTDFTNESYLNQSRPQRLDHFPSSSLSTVKFYPDINDDNEVAPLDFFDNGGNFNTSNHKYIVPAKGMYNFNFSMIGRPFLYDEKNGLAAGLYFAKSKDTSNITPRMELIAKIIRKRGSTITTMATETHEIRLNDFPGVYFYNAKGWTYAVGARKTFMKDFNITVNANNHEYEQGDEVYVELELNNKLVNWYNLLGQSIGTKGFGGGVDLFRSNPDGSGNRGLAFYNTPLPSDGIFLGEEMDMNSCLPTRTRQIDFVNSIIRMFNLIVEEDPLKDNHLIIDPRHYYFSSGSTLDWSFKLDRSQAIEIERIPTLIDKNVQFTYEQDEDKYNADYQETYEESYGDWFVRNQDLTADDEEISVIFSPTPGTEIPGTSIIVPQIYDIDDNDKLINQSYNMRILHRVDIIDAPGSTFRTATSTSNVSIAVNEYSAGVIASTGWVANTIPTASHLDDPYNPTYDLNWGYSKKYYNTLYPTTIDLPTWSNLYNEYWRDYIELLIDPNSKMITAQFNLTEQDIYNFRFYNKIKIDGQYYIVNRIIDWNPNRLTEVVLIKDKVSTLPTTPDDKIIDTEQTLQYNNISYRSFRRPSRDRDNSTVQQQSGQRSFVTASPTRRSMNNNADQINPLNTGQTWNDLSGTTAITTTVTATTETTPTIISEESRGYATGVNNDINSRNFVLSGNDNRYDGNTYNTAIFGDGNSINDGVYNGTIIGNNNEIGGNLSGATIIGNNLTVQQSDTLVLGAGTILSTKPIEPIVHVISAPNLDNKQINPFNRMKQIQVLSGGDIADGSRNLRSANTTFVVDSRTTPVTKYSSYAETSLDADGNTIT